MGGIGGPPIKKMGVNFFFFFFFYRYPEGPKGPPGGQRPPAIHQELEGGAHRVPYLLVVLYCTVPVSYSTLAQVVVWKYSIISCYTEYGLKSDVSRYNAYRGVHVWEVVDMVQREYVGMCIWAAWTMGVWKKSCCCPSSSNNSQCISQTTMIVVF